MLKNISKVLIAMSIVTILPVGAFGAERVSHRNPDSSLDVWFTDTSGNILNGWEYNDSNDAPKGWYYYENGRCYTLYKWIKTGSNWYYVSGGKMVTDKFIDGYYLGSDGVWTDNVPSDSKYKKEDAEASKKVIDELTKGEWYLTNKYWEGDGTFLFHKAKEDGTKVDTICYIRKGKTSVSLKKAPNAITYSELKNYDSVEMTVEEYEELRSENKIGEVSYSAGIAGGKMYPYVSEYIKRARIASDIKNIKYEDDIRNSKYIYDSDGNMVIAKSDRDKYVYNKDGKVTSYFRADGSDVTTREYYALRCGQLKVELD